MASNSASKLFNRDNSGPAAGKPVVRAQNFSVSKLQPQTDRDSAKVSMNRVAQAKKGAGGPTTSVSRTNSSSAVSTSIAHSGKDGNLAGDGNGDGLRDRLRWQRIRRMMREKQAAEQTTASQRQPSKYQVPGMGTGAVFSRRSPAWQSAERLLYKKVREERATLKNIDAKDRKYFLDIVEGHSKKLRTGAGFGRVARRQMKSKIEKDRQRGAIKKADADDFKKMIDVLPH